MNQILDYTPNSGNYNRKSGGGSDNIVRIFAVILIIFAIALIGVVGYSMHSNKKEVNNEAVQVTYANIEVEVEDAQATIIVTHDKNIQKLIYSWNTSSERTIKGSDKYMEETIDVPAGENTLHIKVIDETGNETTYDEEITSERGTDIINPVIDLSITEDKKIKVVATDETVMDFITYRWNEEDEQTIYADEGSKEIEAEIEIPKGKNDLTITAVDGSNNVSNEQKSFTGVVKPEISVTLSEDGTSFDISIKHENGIEKVGFNFNNVEYNVDLKGETPTEIQFPQKLEVGYNRIIVTATSVDGTENKFDGQYDYGS